MRNQAAKKAQKNSNQTRGRNWMVKWKDTWLLSRQRLKPFLNWPIKRPVLCFLCKSRGARVNARGLGKVSRGAGWKESLTNIDFHADGNRKRIFHARTVLSPRFLYYLSLMEKRYLWCKWLCEGKLKVKTAHLQLPSASQKRACLSSLLFHLIITVLHYLTNEKLQRTIFFTYIFTKKIFTIKVHAILRTRSTAAPLWIEPNATRVSRDPLFKFIK